MKGPWFWGHRFNLSLVARMIQKKIDGNKLTFYLAHRQLDQDYPLAQNRLLGSKEEPVLGWQSQARRLGLCWGSHPLPFVHRQGRHGKAADWNHLEYDAPPLGRNQFLFVNSTKRKNRNNSKTTDIYWLIIFPFSVPNNRDFPGIVPQGAPRVENDRAKGYYLEWTRGGAKKNTSEQRKQLK